jgi:catechol 2,3-dioxygenase-like lactoylglutathione lyase family enzyme
MAQSFVHAGVHHVSLSVHDAEQTGRFYTEVLGFEKLPRPDFGVPGQWLRCGPQEVHLIQARDHNPDKAPIMGPHFALRVLDVDAARKALLERGVEVSEPFQIPGGGRQCFFHDPAGNMIELNQPRA